VRLNKQEFERFQHARGRLKRAAEGKMKSDLELAVTMVEDLSIEHQRAVTMIRVLVDRQKKSLCHAVPTYLGLWTFKLVGWWNRVVRRA
jgi:hypothetical protein